MNCRFTFAKEEMEPSLYTKSINLVSSGNINRPSPPIHTIDTVYLMFSSDC